MHQRPVNRTSRVEAFCWPWPAFPVGAAVLLAGSFLYVWLRVEPVLEYHSYGPYFYRQRAFLDTFLARPGGLAGYAGVFLAQLNHWNGLGALIFVLSQCGVLLAALFFLARLGGRAPGFAALVPPFVLLLLRNRYGCPVPAMSVGLFLALAAGAAHVLLPWRRPWLATAVSGLISSFLFFVAGLWPALLFGVLGCLFGVIQMRSRPAGLGCLVLAGVAPLLAIGAGNVPMARLVNPWPEVPWVLAAALYAAVPVAGAVLARLPRPANPRPVSRALAAPALGRGRWFLTVWHDQAPVVLVFLLAGAAVWFTFDPRQKLLAKIDYDANCGRYEGVLAAAKRAMTLNHPAEARLHLALYHTGRLAEDLFSFQNLIIDAPLEEIAESFRAQSQTLFELGLVNDAEHSAHEALEMQGARPDLLRLLARINRLKDRPQAAQVFLNVLSRIPFQGERANEAWPTLDSPMPAAEGAYLAGMRTRVLTNDLLHEELPVKRLLAALLASNPTNQMAFEYLMAYDLMELDLKKAVEHLKLLDNFNYARIPRSYEEALLLYQQVARVRVELKGRTIRPETVERYRQFKEAALELVGRGEGQAALAANFGDTDWFFYYAARARMRAPEDQASAP